MFHCLEETPKLSVIIPAFNEAACIEYTLKRIYEYLSGKGMDFEVLVVDDGSGDSTREIVLKAAESMPLIRLIKNGVNRGKGYSVKNGFLESAGGLVLFSDADLSTPIEELGRFLGEAGKGADIVIGSRALKESKIIRRQPIYRIIMGKTFNVLVRLLTVQGIADTQCGFKLFHRETCRQIFLAQRVERFAFDVEILFLAKRKGLIISELPVHWVNSPLSKVHLVRDSARMLLDIFMVRWWYLLRYYHGF